METTISELDFQITRLKQAQSFNECLSLIEKTIGIKSETFGKRSKEVKFLIFEYKILFYLFIIIIIYSFTKQLKIYVMSAI